MDSRAKRIVVPIAALTASLVLVKLGPSTIGMAVSSADGATKVTAGSGPAPLTASVILAALYLWNLKQHGEANAAFERAAPGRRLLGFVLDFYQSIIIFSPWIALVPLIIEAQRTGTFKWTFQRSYLESADSPIAIFCALSGMAMLLLYFAFPLTRGRVPPGTSLMRLKVRYESNRTPTIAAAIVRSLLGFISLALGFVTLIVAWSRTDRRVLHDLITESYVEKRMVP